MCDALVAAYGTENLSSLGAYPGIVHRLDRGTSGAMTGEEDICHMRRRIHVVHRLDRGTYGAMTGKGFRV